MKIQGVGRGKLNADGTVEVALAVTEASDVSVYLQAESWEIGNQVFPGKGPIIRTSLSKGEYPVKVKVRSREGKQRQADGIIKVRTSQMGEFSLEPTTY